MLTCSFCGLEARSVSALLAGPGVNICDQCIEVGVRTIKTRDALEAQGPTADQQMAPTHDDENLLHQAAASSALVDKSRTRLQSQIDELRNRGIGWAAIGAVLGVSQDVAQQRFE
ncbi:ClpX C4-type zinc finger protein [Thalassococcus sp. S3]|uniref:ClpX C4-type zinc finger protein n=1 Tax=Thalassococcus sp. S3 TaxID=2017482 RepID=UPI00102401C8|nr:ClpX C4-type zinc finger protein [Thalassococcus sp. S3]QBF33387.1 hypothetical protein CFI11_19545 [Thalassococcus sp. S3]